MKKIILSIFLVLALIMAVPASSMARNGHGYYNHGYGHHYNHYGSSFSTSFYFGVPFIPYAAPPVYYAPPPVVYYPPPPPVYYAPPPPSGQLYFGFSMD
jgi:hypothetical protein